MTLLKEKGKTTMALLIVCVMLAGILPAKVYAAATVVQVTSWLKLSEAVRDAAIDGTETIIEIQNNFDKNGNEITIGTGKNITIQSAAGGPYTITRAVGNMSSYFLIYSNSSPSGSLTLKNIILDGNGNNVEATSSIIENGFINNSKPGTFIMDSGAVIQSVNSNIGGNRAGAVSTLGGTFTMKAGSLIQNSENDNAYGIGGVLNTSYAVFNMEGGSIVGCTGGNRGGYGGVKNQNATMNVSGLVNISGNTDVDGTTANVLLSSSTSLDPIISIVPGKLDPRSTIGVMKYFYGSFLTTITGNNSDNYSSNFFSDHDNYVIQNSGSGDAQVVKLVVANNLSALSLSSGSLSPAFSKGTTSYTASVGNSVDSITVTPTVAVTGTTVKVNNVAVASGNASDAINLNVGKNIISVTVTAEGTTPKTYTVTVTRDAPSSSSNSRPCPRVPQKRDPKTIPIGTKNNTQTNDLAYLVAIPEQWMDTTAKVEFWLESDFASPKTDGYKYIAQAKNALKAVRSTLLDTYQVDLMQRVIKKDGTVTGAKVAQENIRSNFTIRLPIPKNLLKTKNLGIVYVEDVTGLTANLASKIVIIEGVSYIEFENNRSAVYGFVSDKNNAATIG